MKKFLFVALCCVFGISNQADADVVINFSTSNLDAAAGSSLNLNVGQEGSMYVWIRTDPGQILTGAALNILSSEANVLEALEYTIQNPGSVGGPRWANVNTGTLGDLVTGSSVFALPGLGSTGLTTNGDFVLHSEIRFSATNIGTTNLSFGVGPQGVADFGGPVTPVFNTGSVNVLTAVPEPSSFALLGLAGAAIGYRRRQLAKRAN